ncbi:TPA: efflux RND transporter periplasmic adaptor subunit [Photobacterium damselae]
MKKPLLLATLIGSALLVGCGEPASGQKPAMAPLAQAQSVQLIQYQQGKSYVGRTEAVEDVAISAQVSGYLKERLFEEGQMVKKGQPLFRIESAAYEAQVKSATAAISQAKAQVQRSNMDFARAQDLLPKGNISKSEYDRLLAEKLNAQAQLESAQAMYSAAKVDLSHTTITAPFSGRVSDSKVSIGDLISPSSGVLTTLVSLDPMHAAFTISERERLNMGLDKLDGSGNGNNKGLVEVVLTLNNGQQYSEIGSLDFVGNRIDLNTGTLAMRAQFANPNQQLLPGQHVQIFLREKTPQQVMVIPRSAVQSDLEGDFVMVLKDGKVAERRNVTMGSQTDQGVIISQGLKADEEVITIGLQRIRNGMTVRLQNEDSGPKA